MWLHVLGACEAGASMRENASPDARRPQAPQGPRRAARGRTVRGPGRRTRAPDTRDELVERLVAHRAEDGQGPQLAPHEPMRAGRGSPSTPRSSRSGRLGYLIDLIYLRDAWMHRVDTARATGRDLELTADHDGRIVADVVAEWARRHGQPFTLELTGPRRRQLHVTVRAATRLALDAVEFCCLLAGRCQSTGRRSRTRRDRSWRRA